MSFKFNAHEVLEMAEQLERNGAKFYRASADSVNDPGSRQMLTELAEMEDRHEKTFANMRAELSEQEKTSPTFDPENETVLYLKALADSRVFLGARIPDIDKFAGLPEQETMEEILKFALGAEKEAIVFFLGMKEAVGGGLGKNRIDEIIKEEMSHIRLLSGKLVSLKR
jgi:rubrerythrin